MLSFVRTLGRSYIDISSNIGKFIFFVLNILSCIIYFKEYYKSFFVALMEILFYSLIIVALTSICMGAVLTVHTYTGLSFLRGEAIIADVVSLAIMRELGPVIIGIVMASKTVSWVTSEIASMRITDQIDALNMIGVNTYAYLLVPRILACCIAFPIILIFTNILSLYGGFIVIEYYLNLSGYLFVQEIINIVSVVDWTIGLFKSFIFALITGFTSCYIGYNTKGGTSEVGKNTTLAIVISLVSIIIVNYFITYLFSLFIA